MAKRKKLLLVITGSLFGLLVILMCAGLLIVRTQWFSDFVRAKIIASLEDSTGGRVEIQSFRFEPGQLTARIDGLVIHGTEPAGVNPLATIAHIELKLKLFSSLRKAVDLAYLGIDEPQVNLIVNSDGSTNIPNPKVKSPPSSESPVETVVDLAVGAFRIDHGSISYSQKTTPLALQGDNLRVLLQFNPLNQTYIGNIAIAPLRVSEGANPPLAVRVDLPLTLERDAARLTNSRLTTDSSEISFDASLYNLKAPKLKARVHAKLSLAEMQRSFNFPIASGLSGIPTFVTADLDGGFDQTTKVTALRTFNIGLGKSTFSAFGDLNPSTGQTIQFNSDLVLTELGQLFKLSTPRVAGNLLVKGSARLDSKQNYFVNGNLASQNLAVQNGTSGLSAVSLSAPFNVNSAEITLNPLRVSALGGVLSAKILVQQLRRLTVEGDLRDFSLNAIATAAAGQPIGYGGLIAGTVNAASDLQAKGNAGLLLNARLSISPRNGGIPVKGRIEADYEPQDGLVKVQNSHITLPSSRLTVSGSLNKQINLQLTSRNLNDFLPVANFDSKKPRQSLPITLKNGVANLDSQIQGDLTSPRITAHAAVTNFVARDSFFNQLSFNLSASPAGAKLQNGLLSRNTEQSVFDGSIGLIKWKPVGHSPLAANVTIRNAGLGDLLALGGAGDFQATGDVNSEIHVYGTYGDPLGYATLQILHGSAYGQPFDHLQSRVNLSHDLVSLDNLSVSAAKGTLTASGFFRHPGDDIMSGHLETHVRSNGIQLAAVSPLQQQSPGSAGAIQLSADAAGDLSHKGTETELKLFSIEANLSATNLRVRNQNAGSLTAIAHTTSGAVTYNVKSDFAGSDVHLDGHTSLTSGYVTEARASIRSLPLANVLEITGQGDVPVAGMLTADATLAGTLQAPDIKVDLDLSKANIYQEPIDSLTAKVRYTNSLAEISSFKLQAPAGDVNLTARYNHLSDIKNGSLELRLDSGNIDIAKIKHAQLAEPGVAGTVHVEADVAANIVDKNGAPQVQVVALNTDDSAKGLRVANRQLGGLDISARTSQSQVTFQVDSDIAQSKIHASGQSQLIAGYPTRAELSFANLRYKNIAPFLSSDDSTAPSFDALVEGNASVNGPILNVNGLLARLELSHLEINTSARASTAEATANKTVGVQNEGPIVVSLNKSVAKVEQFHIRGSDTSIDVLGAIDLHNSANPLQLKVAGNADLGILQNINRNFYSSGKVALNANIGGSFTQPLLNGQVEVHNANVNYSDSPNGLANGNGVILLQGTTALVQNLTGESGGGKIALSGFVGLSPKTVVYNLHAKGTNVRTRYSGVSITSSAAVDLTGNSRRSLLSGTVTIKRVAYSSSSDVGSLLNSAASPPSIDTTPSPLLEAIKLDIRVSTSSDVRIVSTYVDKLDLKSALTVRGTVAQPGIVGFINVTDGQLAFFGNTYTVNRGVINFYDPSAIRPELDLSLETIAQSVDVVLGVTGPINNMKLSYRSDPPLTFEQIVQLLATNTTPNDPTIAAHQPTPPQQSMTQMGESAVLGQAVASPLASRVQRVFGLSQFKIDPSVAGSNGQPTARVTLQQKIASNITFTYITDVTQSNSEIIRIEWDLNSKTSAVALRDYNGNVSVELFYKFQVR